MTCGRAAYEDTAIGRDAAQVTTWGRIARSVPPVHQTLKHHGTLNQMKTFRLSMAAAALLACVATHGAHAQGRPAAQRSSATAPTLYDMGPLDGLSISFAFSRMAGTTPDFRPYAEATNTYKNATVYDRPTVLTREIARLESQFQTFDLDRVYSMRIGVPIKQFNPEQRGYSIGFSEGSQISLSDPVTYRTFRLAFRNASDVNFVPAADATAARNFAQKNGLDMQRESAGDGAIEIAFRLADAPPSLNGSGDTVRADILAARLVSQTGAVMYDFGNTTAATASPARSADGVGAMPMLKAVDTQGFRVGMTMEEVEALGSRGWKTRIATQPNDEKIVFFNGLTAERTNWVRCGTMERGYIDPRLLIGGGIPQMPPFADCVAVKLNTTIGALVPKTLASLATEQRLATSDSAALLAALRTKYGVPTYVRNDGTNLVWIGRDPANPDSPAVQVMADVSLNGQGAARQTVLMIEIQAYADPRPKPAPAPPAAAGPKL